MMNLSKLRIFLENAFILHRKNPGWNVTAIITLGGVALMGLSFLLYQLGFPHPDDAIIEIGKAAFYAGLGRASSQSEKK